VWVLATEALIADSLQDNTKDSTLLLERALLLNEDFVIGYGMLSYLLRERGFTDEAVYAAAQGFARSPGDEFVVRQWVAALIDLGEYREALALVDDYIISNPEVADFLAIRATLYLRLEKPEKALAAVNGEEANSPYAKIMRATCHRILDHDDEARREFDAIWNQRDARTGRSAAAWAAYHTRRFEESVELLTSLVKEAPRAAQYNCQLGLVLLVRGDSQRDDVVAGERALHTGIEATTQADELVDLRTVEIPIARRAVGGAPHEMQVLAALDVIERNAADRYDVLGQITRPPAGLSARFALARIALAQNSPGDACDAYMWLVTNGGPAEARLGLSKTIQALLVQGDQLMVDNDVRKAKSSWEQALRAAMLLADNGAIEQGVTQALQARLALAIMEDEGPEAAAKPLAAVLSGADGDEQALASAIRTFARDLPSAWAHRTGLRTLADHPSFARTQQATLARLADGLPFDEAYLLRRSDVPADIVFPLVSPVEVLLGSRHLELTRSPRLDVDIPALRERLVQETGVRIPGVRVRGGAGVPPGDMDFLVYEERVKRVPVQPASEDPASVLVEGLEHVVRDQLFRLISPDDIPFWVEGWEVSRASEMTSVPPDAEARLRLVRVLRHLLRENVPIVDRGTILKAFRDAEDGGSLGPLNTLRKVRCELGPVALGYEPGIQLHQMPEELEEKVRAGLSPDRRFVWELNREEAAQLLGDMRAWLSSEVRESPAAFVVRDAEARPFVWRLLASERPPVRVFAEEELK
jgi:tetratricopeptide (TPR) repeat protein